jgi:hypothetical protein
MLTSEVAENLFSRICATNAPDSTFLSTLRALLHKRLPQNETVRLTCKAKNYTAQDISNASVAACMSSFVPELSQQPDAPGHNIYIIYATQIGVGEKMLGIVKANTGRGKRYMSNFTRRDDLQVFYARKVNALFYTDETERNTVIFAEEMELKHFHVLQMMIPKYLPKLFAEIPLTEAEIKLLKCTGGKSADEYERLIEDFARELDIRSEIIRTKLAGFTTGFERTRSDELRNEINIHQNEYDLYLSKMREVSQKIDERKYTLAGLECAIGKNSGDSELMEYFMCNKNLHIARVSGTRIEFVAHGYADIYDLEAFETYVENLDGFFYGNISSSIEPEQMEMLYMAIFSECKYKLRICAAYTADMRTGLRAFQSYSFPHESRTYFPNPHIQSFGCIGSYAGKFQEYMQKRDYVGAIDQAVVSARNLNFYDSAVISSFGRDFSRTSIKCLERADGKLLTPKEAIKELEGGA